MLKLPLLLGFAVAAMSFDRASAQTTQYALEIGQPHPDFILPTIEDGKPLQLSSFRGKKVLLMHFASW